MPKRKCVFNKNLQKEFPFLEKDKNDSHVHCKRCNSHFSISTRGRGDIFIHLKTQKHMRCERVALSNGDSNSSIKIRNKETINNINNITICRTCRNYLNTKDATNLFAENKHKILEKIKNVTGCLLRNDKDFPGQICKNCVENLETAHLFRERCLDSQSYFYSPEFKEQLVLKLTKNTYNSNQSSDDIPQELEEVMLDIKNEIISTEDHENNTLEISNKCGINEFLNLKGELQQTYENLEDPKDEISRNVNITEALNTFNNVGIETRKDFICDRCGNHFSSRQHFKTHLIRHTNHKPFKCEVCPKQCYTASELKNHMRRHTGERPFACKYCQRCFADYSTRVRHERTHTNEKPYACSQCKKAFTRSSLLQKHFLVHTGERPFKCLECNKAFQTQTHLKVHCRSVMHKQKLKRKAQTREPN